jgi:predicted O-linked N-acetylglucosamine transferase (SPINDLY family)
VGLPKDAFVYCCLNGSQKITPGILQDWIAILHQVPGSVLWLLSANRETDDRLRQLVAESGIAPERLIFAEKKANPQHLAR